MEKLVAALDRIGEAGVTTRWPLVPDTAREPERPTIFEPHASKQRDFESCAMGRPHAP